MLFCEATGALAQANRDQVHEIRVVLQDLDDDPGEPRWLPEGDLTESIPGAQHRYRAKWVGENPNDASPKLMEVVISPSSFLGVAGNWGENTDFDAEMRPSKNPGWDGFDHGLGLRRTVARETWVTFKFETFDFGAEVELVVTVERGSKQVDAPYDLNDNGMPDALEDRVDLPFDYPPDPKEDADTKIALTSVDATTFDDHDSLLGFPAAQFGFSGDGLSAWEEYRGFSIDFRHHRLNPEELDLFVAPITLRQQALQHGWLVDNEFRGGVRFHVVRGNEMDLDTRLINSNSPTHKAVDIEALAYDWELSPGQSGVKIFFINGEAFNENGERRLGVARKIDGIDLPVNVSPNGTDYVDVYMKSVRNILLFEFAENEVIHLDDAIATVTTHELGHSMHIKHYPQSDVGSAAHPAPSAMVSGLADTDGQFFPENIVPDYDDHE